MNRTTSLPILVFTLSFLAIGACSGEPPKEDEPENGGVGGEKELRRQQPLAGTTVSTDTAGQNAFINATAMLVGNGRACTGVLISPSQLLTAGHCVCGAKSVVAPGASVIFPTLGGSTNSAPPGRIFTMASATPNPNWQAGNCQSGNGERRSYDIGIVSLTAGVPASVATPVKLYFGSHTELAPNGFFTAGYGAIGTGGDVLCGNPDHDPCQAFDGFRRNAQAGWLTLEDDPCDTLELGTYCWHRPVYLTGLAPLGVSLSLSGDSGAPIVGFPNGSSEAQLVALHSGRVDPSYQYGYAKMVRVRLANSDIRDFITANLVTSIPNDLDSDGVSDSIDNCPPGTCVAKGIGKSCSDANPDQLDADGDGVGDACDNCSPNDTKLCPTAAACANPGQLDTGDADGVGDICDPFPSCKANSFLTCTGCALAQQADYCQFNGGTSCGTNQFTASCTSATPCPSAPGQQCLFDGGPNGRCLKALDSDNDGLGDVCDACPNFVNDLAKGQLNSNWEAELYANLPVSQQLADQCDPVPIAILDDPPSPPVQTLDAYGVVIAQPATAEVQRHGFTTTNSLGKLTSNEVARSTSGTLKFLGCQCDTSATFCVDPIGYCKAADPAGVNNVLWKPITMTNSTGGQLAMPPTSVENFSNTAQGATRTWYWKWWTDRQAGTFSLPLVTTKGNGQALQYPYLLGGIAVQVDAPSWSTGRTREDNNNLRYTFIQAYPGAVGTKKTNAHGNLPQFIEPDCLYGPGCAVWANWRKLIYINPGDMLYDEGLTVGLPHDGVIDMGGYDTDSEVPVKTTIAQTLSRFDSYVAAHPAESTKERRSNGDFREFAIISRVCPRSGLMA